MPLPDLFKLEKLKILAFVDQKRRPSDAAGEFEAMFNPESIKQSYGVRFGPDRGIGSTDGASTYLRTEPSELELELLLDGTGVTDQIALPPGPAVKTVSQRVDEFLGMAFREQGESHQPNYLRVLWGDLWGNEGFDCRLLSVEVTYSRFARDGKPLRATLAVVLKSDATWERQVREANRTSPDLTHTHLVQAGDTLPLLAERIYGSPGHALLVARFNGLDDLRFLEPGTELAFPPLPGHGKRGTAAR